MSWKTFLRKTAKSICLSHLSSCCRVCRRHVSGYWAASSFQACKRQGPVPSCSGVKTKVAILLWLTRLGLGLHGPLLHLRLLPAPLLTARLYARRPEVGSQHAAWYFKGHALYIQDFGVRPPPLLAVAAPPRPAAVPPLPAAAPSRERDFQFEHRCTKSGLHAAPLLFFFSWRWPVHRACKERCRAQARREQGGFETLYNRFERRLAVHSLDRRAAMRLPHRGREPDCAKG